MNGHQFATARERADPQPAIEYLLLSNLNSTSRLDQGKPGNDRLLSLWWDVLEKLQPTVFCDIGAFDGSAAIAAKQRFPGALVYAFEANPEVFKMCASSPALVGIQYRNLAVSDSVGPVQIYAPRTLAQFYSEGQVLPGHIEEPKATGKTSLLRRNEDATYAEFSVPGTTLDAFIEGESIPAPEPRFALWVDAEGAADKVLRGAASVLARTVAILIETESFEFWKEQKDSASITSELIRHGFVPVARDREYGDHQFNILFVKAESITALASELFRRQSPLRSCLVSSEEAPATERKRSCSSIAAHFQTAIPIVIPVFNSITYLRNMLSALLGRGLRNIIVVDNASTFPPFLDYLSRIGSDVNVIRLNQNRGPHDLFMDRKNYGMLPQYFCLTDPDLEFNPNLPEDFLAELAALTEEYRVGKAGFALDLSDHSLMRDEVFEIEGSKYRIWEWEARFWKQPVGRTSAGDQVYSARIDTTFAVYNKKYFDPADHAKAVRVAGRFTCRHLPWYRDTRLSKDEEDFYRANERFSYYLKAKGPAPIRP